MLVLAQTAEAREMLEEILKDAQDVPVTAERIKRELVKL
jgi:hypothetical protein